MKLRSEATAFMVISICLQKVVCSCVDGDLRLTGTYDNISGRVEFCHEGEWGTVCDDSWDENDARVVCRQLNLPTKVVNALSGFGGGSGEIFIDNSKCNGSEPRLDNCPHNGIRNHNCDETGHHEDAGVICFSDEDISCDYVYETPLHAPAPCGEEGERSQPSKACVHRHGSCVPFYPIATPSICDDLYEPGIDYVYVPNGRSRGSFSRLIEDIAEFGPALLVSLDNCFEQARLVLCHYYLPPCGNATVFQPPTAVCPEQCNLISQLCPTEWANVVRDFVANDIVISAQGLQLIDCMFPGKHLSPLPHCCSDVGLNITLPPKEAVNGSSSVDFDPVYIAVGSVVAALVILTPLIAVPILCVLSRHCRQPKAMVISNPKSFGRPMTREIVDVVIDDVPTVMDRYMCSDDMSTLRVERSGPHIPRVLSGFLRQMSEEKLLIPEENIKLISIVGQGEFGVVYRGTLHGWKEYVHDVVAIKTLKGMFSASDLKHLVEESKIMTNFDHPNVMKILGVAISKQKSLFVVMPYMSQGSLLSFLRRHRADMTVENEDMTDLINELGTRLLSMCLQIAKGMAYLASQKFLHRDLAARNCMIDENHVIKVSDFGLSEDVYARNYFRQGTPNEDGDAPVKLPVKWMALESLNDGIFSEKSDVWSFGVTCWEVFSLGKNPYPGVDPFSLMRYLERGERLDRPLNTACSQEIYEMMSNCWNGVPEKRPTFSELVQDISISLEGMGGYLDLTT